MKKYYTEPEIEVRNYVLLEDVMTVSGDKEPDLNGGEDGDAGNIL